MWMSCTCATLFSGRFVHVLRGIWNFATEVGKLQIRSTKVWDYLFSRFQGLDGRCEQQKKVLTRKQDREDSARFKPFFEQWWGWWDAKRYKSSVRRNIKKQFGTCINVADVNVSWMYQQTNSLHKLLQLRGCWRHAEYGGLPSKRFFTRIPFEFRILTPKT